MLIFIYGQDTYRSHQKLKEVIDHYKKVHCSGLNLKYYDGQTLNFKDFLDEFQTASMFKEKKLAILINVFSNYQFKENFLKIANKFLSKTKDIILFFEKREIPESDPLFKFLKKFAKSQQFKPLVGQRLKNWIKKEFQKYKVNFEPEVVTKLIELGGNDLWQLSNEIKKLVSYKVRSGKIELRDVELLIRPKLEKDIFQTIDAIASKNKKLALSLIHNHLRQGESPLYLLAMLDFQFRNILEIKEKMEKNTPYFRILNSIQLHPLLVKKSWQQAKKFTLLELKKIYRKLFRIDFNIKTGKIEPEIGLELLISEL